VYPVRGQVLLDGKPLPGVLVVFHPVVDEGFDSGRPTAQTDAEGRFTVITHGLGDGVPAGEYRVAVVELRAGGGETDVQSDVGGPPGVRTTRPPAVYGRPETSGLKVTVVQEANDLGPFRLRSGPRDRAKSAPLPEIE
jgi:hypothetical protein